MRSNKDCAICPHSVKMPQGMLQEVGSLKCLASDKSRKFKRMSMSHIKTELGIKKKGNIKFLHFPLSQYFASPNIKGGVYDFMPACVVLDLRTLNPSVCNSCYK